MKDNAKKKLFVIDDENDFLVSIKAWGNSGRYEVTTFEGTDGFLDALIEQQPDIILVDVNLKDDDGRLISQDLKNILPFKVIVILISADPAALLEYQSHAANGILIKPFSFQDLENKLAQHLRR